MTSSGSSLERLLGDLLEAVWRHACGVFGLGRLVETQDGEPLAHRALVVAALLEGGAEQPARVGLLVDGEVVARDDLLSSLTARFASPKSSR